MTTVVSIIAGYGADRKRFIKELFEALSSQTHKDFIVQITCDPRCDRESLFDLMESYAGSLTVDVADAPDIKNFPKDHKDQRFYNQETRLNRLSASDTVFLLDDDDTIPENYIEMGLKKLGETSADIVTADLWAWGDGILGFEPVLSPRLRDGQAIKSKDMLNENRIGLGHVVMRGVPIGEAFSEISKKEFKVLDWAVFAHLLHQGYTATFGGRDFHIYYRQHAGQVLGIRKLDGEDLVPIMQRKQKHYAAMMMMPGMSKAWADVYKGLDKAYSKMLERANQAPQWLDKYAQEMQGLAKSKGADQTPFWQESAQVSAHADIRSLLFRNKVGKTPVSQKFEKSP